MCANTILFVGACASVCVFVLVRHVLLCVCPNNYAHHHHQRFLPIPPSPTTVSYQYPSPTCTRTHLQVGRCHRVAGAIGIRKCIQKRIQTALHELHKWLLDGVLAASTQHAVLEDVGDALAVLHRGAQDHTKALVLIVGDQAHDVCTRLLVPVLRGRKMMCIGEEMMCVWEEDDVYGEAGGSRGKGVAWG